MRYLKNINGIKIFFSAFLILIIIFAVSFDYVFVKYINVKSGEKFLIILRKGYKRVDIEGIEFIKILNEYSDIDSIVLKLEALKKGQSIIVFNDTVNHCIYKYIIKIDQNKEKNKEKHEFIILKDEDIETLKGMMDKLVTRKSAIDKVLNLLKVIEKEYDDLFNMDYTKLDIEKIEDSINQYLLNFNALKKLINFEKIDF